MNLLDRFFELCGFDGPIERAERPLWAAVRTFDDIAELTARWLAGEIQSQPGYYGPVDVDEDVAPGLTTTLISLNRSGFLTYNSQAGHDGIGHDDAYWTAHAVVDGFATDDALTRITAAMHGTRFIVIAHRMKTRVRHVPPAVPLTFRAGHATWGCGHHFGRRDIASMYHGLSDEALDALCEAWQLTVFDPVSGHNEMWATLARAAAAPLEGETMATMNLPRLARIAGS